MEITIASLAVTVAKLEVLLKQHLEWHDKVFWFIIVPVVVGCVVTLVNHWTLKKFIKNGGAKNDRP